MSHRVRCQWVFAVTALSGLAVQSLTAAEHPPLAIAPFDSRQAGDLQKTWSRHLERPVVEENSIGMKMVLIPPGEFTMGMKDEAAVAELKKNMLASDGYWDRVLGKGIGPIINLPGHRVRLNRPFYMGAHEVTVGQFRQFIEQSGYKTDAERGLVYEKPYQGKQPIRTWQKTFYEQPNDHPVLQVGWKDCMAFCKWLSEQEAGKGHVYSLPTDAEWEFACRAGTTTLWHFGGPEEYKQTAPQYANMSWTKGVAPRPIAVGQKKPNAFGLFDMHGNLCEWVKDWHHWYYFLETPLNDPAGPATQNEHKVVRRWIRGGAYNVSRYWARSDMRIRIHQGSNQHDHVGFRVAMHIRDIPGVEPAVEPDMRIVGEDKSPADPVAAQAAAATKDRPKEFKINLGNDTSMEFVLVPAGSFLMGSLKGGRYERPVHQVEISQPFYIGKYEVTQSQWDAVMGNGNHRARWGEKTAANLRKEWVGPNKPMYRVSWNDWQTYLDRLSKRVRGHSFALPTEAQWEYACRAGSRTEYCFGDEPALLGDYAWVTPLDAPHPRERQWPELTVGQKEPNAWGIYDMHGNVWEWVQDWWDKDYYSKSTLVDPRGPADGALKVLRGGAVKSYGRFARSAFRLFVYPDVPDDDRSLLTGVRLVINLPDTDPVLVAHRGMLRQAPENTLPAFAYCLDRGMGFELDIRTSKDGRLVVLHDNTLGRTTNGPDRSVREFTLAELKKFDAGTWFDPAFANERIPTLEETFELIRQRRRGRTIIALNVKDVTEQGEKRLVQLVEHYELLDDSFAFDQSEKCSRRLKTLNPKLRIGSNVNRKTIDARLKEGLLDVFLVTFTPTADEVRRLHEHGKQVVYNFGGSAESRRNPEVWSKARQAGIDGLLTDFPLECRQHWQTSNGGERE